MQRITSLKMSIILKKRNLAVNLSQCLAYHMWPINICRLYGKVAPPCWKSKVRSTNDRVVTEAGFKSLNPTFSCPQKANQRSSWVACQVSWRQTLFFIPLKQWWWNNDLNSETAWENFTGSLVSALVFLAQFPQHLRYWIMHRKCSHVRLQNRNSYNFGTHRKSKEDTKYC